MRAKLAAAIVAVLLFAAPSMCHALVEIGVGWGLTDLGGDLEDLEAGPGLAGELTLGSGAARFMVAAQESSHDPGDANYSTWGVGPSWRLDIGGAVARICALVSNHSFEDAEGWGVTLGGGVAWPILPGARFGIEARVSQWEGDGLDARSGTLFMVLTAGF